MPTVTRTKGDKVHYVRGVLDNGSITSMTDHVDQAADVPPDVCDKIAANYDGRVNAGKYTFTDHEGKPIRKPVEGPIVPEKLSQGTPLQALQKRFDEQGRELEKAYRNMTDAVTKCNSANAEIVTLQKEREELKAENTQLKADLAAAEELNAENGDDDADADE